MQCCKYICVIHGWGFDATIESILMPVSIYMLAILLKHSAQYNKAKNTQQFPRCYWNDWEQL